jgi:hypothetical protein
MNMPPVKKTTAKPAVKTTAKPVAKKTIAAKESKAEIIARLKSKYDLVEEDSGLFLIKKGKEWGFANSKGEVKITPRFYGLGSRFVEGVISTFHKDGLGFVNTDCKEIVKSKYGVSRDFCNGMAAVGKNQKWGFVDKNGKEVVALKYDSVENFKGDKAKVTLKGKSFEIGKDGKPVEDKPKPVIKKNLTSKADVKKATEISVSGNKKIGTLQKEFNKKFPYLQLCLFYSYMRNESTKTQLPEDKTLASVRRADSGGDISISGNKKIKSLEKEFDTVFGLYAQVCYYNPDGKGFYTSGSADEKTLVTFNAECEAKGCIKGKYR